MANRIDRVGRVVIPKQLRLEVGLAPGSRLEFEAVRDGILVKKGKADSCVACGAEKDLISLNDDVFLCRSCAKKQILPNI